VILDDRTLTTGVLLHDWVVVGDFSFQEPSTVPYIAFIRSGTLIAMGGCTYVLNSCRLLPPVAVAFTAFDGTL